MRIRKLTEASEIGNAYAALSHKSGMPTNVGLMKPGEIVLDALYYEEPGDRTERIVYEFVGMKHEKGTKVWYIDAIMISPSVNADAEPGDKVTLKYYGTAGNSLYKFKKRL